MHGQWPREKQIKDALMNRCRKCIFPWGSSASCSRRQNYMYHGRSNISPSRASKGAGSQQVFSHFFLQILPTVYTQPDVRWLPRVSERERSAAALVVTSLHFLGLTTDASYTSGFITSPAFLSRLTEGRERLLCSAVTSCCYQTGPSRGRVHASASRRLRRPTLRHRIRPPEKLAFT